MHPRPARRPHLHHLRPRLSPRRPAHVIVHIAFVAVSKVRGRCVESCVVSCHAHLYAAEVPPQRRPRRRGPCAGWPNMLGLVSRDCCSRSNSIACRHHDWVFRRHAYGLLVPVELSGSSAADSPPWPHRQARPCQMHHPACTTTTPSSYSSCFKHADGRHKSKGRCLCVPPSVFIVCHGCCCYCC